MAITQFKGVVPVQDYSDLENTINKSMDKAYEADRIQKLKINKIKKKLRLNILNKLKSILYLLLLHIGRNNKVKTFRTFRIFLTMFIIDQITSPILKIKLRFKIINKLCMDECSKLKQVKINTPML